MCIIIVGLLSWVILYSSAWDMVIIPCFVGRKPPSIKITTLHQPYQHTRSAPPPPPNRMVTWLCSPL